jgi:cell division septal protein FtsQ
LVRGRRKKRKTTRRKRSQTRQGYVFEATTTTTAKRFTLTPLALLWQKHGGAALSTLLLAAVAWLSFTLFATDTFYVYAVAVQGNAVVPQAEIFQASGVESQSIFWINPQRTAEAIAQLPDIQSAEVTCRLPAKVNVRVAERQARVIWQWGEQKFWVDSDGVVLKPRGPLTDALIVRDLRSAPPHLGGRVDAGAVAAAQALHDQRPQLQTVGYDAIHGIVLTSEEGWPVYLGTGDDIALKLSILDVLRDDLRQRGIRPKYVDLRYPQRPAYR